MEEVVLNVGVDRLQVGLVFETATSPEFVQVLEWVRSAKHKEHGKWAKVMTHPASSLTGVSQPLQHGHLFVRYGYNHKKFRVWFCFNPNKTCMYELRGHLLVMLEHGGTSLIQRGEVTYCEFHVDVDNAAFDDFIYIDRSLRVGDQTLAQQGTHYLGSWLADRSFTVYDKAKELLDKKKPGIGHNRLRLEAKLRGKKHFPMSQLPVQTNHFAGLIVCDKKLLRSSTDPKLKSLQEALAQGVSPQKAYSSLPRATRASTFAAMDAVRAPWWVPGEIWKAFPDSLMWLEQLAWP